MVNTYLVGKSSRAATVKEWLPVSQSLFGSGHAWLGMKRMKLSVCVLGYAPEALVRTQEYLATGRYDRGVGVFLQRIRGQ